MNDSGPDYKVAAHMTFPSAKNISLMHGKDCEDAIPQEIFPAPASRNAIVRQYTNGPVYAVTLEIEIGQNPLLTCSLAFQSSDDTGITLCFKVIERYEHEVEWQMPSLDFYCKVLSQASRTIRDHPLLANVAIVNISHTLPSRSWFHSHQTYRKRSGTNV